MNLLIPFLFIIIGCSHSLQSVGLKNRSNLYSLSDISGKYLLKRDVVMKKNSFVTRYSIFSPGNDLVPLEKSISVSKVGVNNKKIAILPTVSQFHIWFEQNKFFSQLKTNSELKAIESYSKDPESGVRKGNIKFPKGRLYCWLSQIPECIKLLRVKSLNPGQQLNLYVLMNNYPYLGEQFSNISNTVFIPANLSYDGEVEGEDRFQLLLDNQFIFYHLKDDILEKILWISQGYSVTRVE